MNELIAELTTVEQLTDVELYALSKPSDIARIVAQSVEYGERDPLELLIAFTVLAKSYKLLRENTAFMRAVEREIERSRGKDKAGRFGYVANVQVRTDYDFEGCNDPHWTQLQRVRIENDKAIKAREAYLKAVQGEASDANSEGVFITPPSTTTKTIISIS
jgi:hypothetical protein